jgi:hypothetical protein
MVRLINWMPETHSHGMNAIILNRPVLGVKLAD